MHVRTHRFFLALLIGAAGVAQAQTTGQFRPSPQTAPAAQGAVASRPLPGAPSANGLSLPAPPAVALPAITGATVTGTSVPGMIEGNGSDIHSGIRNEPFATNVMGAGAYGSRGIVRAGTTGPMTPQDVARSFIGADANRDGELTRAEATRLTILPLTFEEMDANHDDRLTRSEYENALL